MKVFIIADLHGNLDRYREAFEVCKNMGCQELWLAGDLLPHIPTKTLEEYTYAQSKFWDTELVPILRQSQLVIRGFPGNDDVPGGTYDTDGILYTVPTLVTIHNKQVLFNPYLQHRDWHLWREIEVSSYSNIVVPMVSQADIIITHQPPLGYLDTVYDDCGYKYIGSRIMRDVLLERARYSVNCIHCYFGHNHGQAGERMIHDNVEYHNVCVVKNISNGVVLDLDTMKTCR
jgi:Icc-related predicted phosphoesterase